jgi:hypothetical protein
MLVVVALVAVDMQVLVPANTRLDLHCFLVYKETMVVLVDTEEDQQQLAAAAALVEQVVAVKLVAAVETALKTQLLELQHIMQEVVEVLLKPTLAVAQVVMAVVVMVVIRTHYQAQQMALQILGAVRAVLELVALDM